MIYYVDGSAHPNPGPGGFSVIELTDSLSEQPLSTYSKYYDNTTNNRMELSAILWVMENKCFSESLEKNNLMIIPIIYSDSAYAINCFNNWIFTWRNNGWKRSGNKPIENLDIMKKYIELYDKGYRIDLRKVKGHDGNKWNELADKIAKGEQ